MSRRIDSPGNPLVKSLAALKDRRARERTGTFLIEGRREGARALRSDLELETLLFAPGLLRAGPGADELLEAASRRVDDSVELSQEAFGRLSVRQNPDGFALLARRPDRGLDQLGSLVGRLVLVLDGVEKPGNVGALIRTADAAGVGAVIVTGAGSDLDNPNVVRASQGSVFSVPVAVAEAGDVIARLRRDDHRIVATTPHAVSAHWDADYRGSVAVLVGAEDKGISPAWLAQSDVRVRIPMNARVADSLNVSVAGAVVMFEAVRQRSLG